MTTYMIHIPLDMRAFNRWAGQRGLIRQGVFDEGYALHILLTGMFGPAVLRPFRLFASERRRNASLYAYTDADETALQSTANLVATPDCLDALNPKRIRSKLMHTEFTAGQRLGFDLRIRPVRRLQTEIHDQKSGKTIGKGAEIDAFLVHVIRHFPDGWADEAANARAAGETREMVYTEWLAERFDGVAVIEKETCRIAAFKRSRSLRGDGFSPEGPDVTFHGVLTIANPHGFALRIRNGIGRHKAYGYGMLLLRAPGTAVAYQ